MSKISELSDGGALQSTDYLIAVRSGGNVKVQPNGTVTGTTGSFSGNVTFADNAKAIFGAGSDLQIYHDGSQSYISDQGVGSLNILASNLFVKNAAGTEDMARFSQDGGVWLYYDNALKLQTTATGIDVTGSVEADGASVSGDAYFGANMYVQSVDGTNAFYVTRYGTVTTESAKFTLDDNDLIINSIQDEQYGGYTFKATHNGVGTANRLDIANNGDISFYEDTGTTPKFFWDASAERLGLGTTSPSAILDIRTAQNSTSQFTSPFIKLFPSATTNTTGFTGITYGTSTSDNFGWSVGGLRTEASADVGAFVFNFHNNSASGSEKVRITSAGNVGIGTSSIDNPQSWGRIVQVANSGSNGAAISVKDSNNEYNIATYNGVLLFSDGVTERMRIDSSGNLLVNTTATASSNNNGFTAEPYAGGIVINVGHNGSALNGDGYVFFRRNGTALGSITQVSSTGVAYNTTSDYRLKDVDGPITNSGAYIDALKPVQGSWKVDGSRFIGLIAHEVQEVSETPIATGEKDGEEMQGMDYSSPELIANLIAEIQSLRARVAQLEGA